jgi:hypothetical protein
MKLAHAHNPLLVLLAVTLFFPLTLVAKEKKGEEGLKISGYVGTSSSTPASGVNVVLINKATGATVDSVSTGFLGRYKFSDVAPGTYLIKAEKVVREVVIVENNIRMDIDLSAPGGAMDYGKSAQAQATGGATPSVGPGDPALLQAMAGQYYSYSGSTERKVTLCSDGTFISSSEWSASYSSRDSLGNDAGGGGAASQNRNSGSWSVQGNQQNGTITMGYRGGKTDQVRYESMGERGCYRFNGNPFCYSGAANCR